MKINGFKIKYSAPELKEKLSQYMKEHNPMYNKETSKKVGKTIRTKYETGEIKKVFGKDHWNYKGSRTIKGYLRLCLGNWIKDNLVRTDHAKERKMICREQYIHWNPSDR